jgi:hypothetical protein
MFGTVDRRRRAVRRVRVIGAMVAAASLAGMLALAAGTPRASADAGSALTVSWANDRSSASSYQPARSDDASGHYGDFKNLKVTVSQTQNLIDQAVTVTATGLAPTTNLSNPGLSSNYLQLMQCWGDPSSATFSQNCAFGAWGNSGFDQSVGQSKLQLAGAGQDVYLRPSDVPFTSVYGQTSTPSGTLNGIQQFFTTSTGNEQDFVPIFSGPKTDNSTSIAFNVQSGASAPWLGCGDTAYPDGQQCWLVIVPRGTHSGSFKGATGARVCEPAIFGDSGYGTQTAAQIGSPLSKTCSFWNDRMVVPLNFAATGSKCPQGAPEVSTNGSMLMNAAMSSWQGSVCATKGGSVFNLINTAGLLTRKQLLQGTTKLAFLGQPVTAADDPDGAYLPSADIRYAPVANTAISIGFLIEKNTRVTKLKLTPRLVAKMLTQSYRLEIPPETNQFEVPYLPKNPLCITQDKEFTDLNPSTTGEFDTLCTSPSSGLIVSGPQGDDAIQLVWQWMEADRTAAAWLAGAPDERGMVVNPYYLPASNPASKGGGLGLVDLAKGPVDTFYRADQTSWPALNSSSLSLDSVAWNPFSNDFGGVATRILNGDSQQASGRIADLSSSVPTFFKAAPEIVGSGLAMMGVTDQPDVEQYGLDAAALQPANQPGFFVTPDDDSMAAAIGSQTPSRDPDPAGGMATVDFSKMSNRAYPLTVTVYAAMNINDSTLDLQTRARYATLVDYAVTTGQVQGTSRGQLPFGYAPLTRSQQIQSLELELILLGKLDPSTRPATAPTPGDTADAGEIADGGVPSTNDVSVGDSPQAVGDVAPGGITVTTPGAASNGAGTAAAPAAQRQKASATVAGQAALGGSLGAGILGMAAAPFLMRRKAITP